LPLDRKDEIFPGVALSALLLMPSVAVNSHHRALQQRFSTGHTTALGLYSLRLASRRIRGSVWSVSTAGSASGGSFGGCASSSMNWPGPWVWGATRASPGSLSGQSSEQSVAGRVLAQGIVQRFQLPLASTWTTEGLGQIHRSAKSGGPLQSNSSVPPSGSSRWVGIHRVCSTCSQTVPVKWVYRPVPDYRPV
jgi:hypothetical protein